MKPLFAPYFAFIYLVTALFSASAQKTVTLDPILAGTDTATYMLVDELPIPLNLDEVRSAIGYPSLARDAGIEGTVIVQLLLDEKGNHTKHHFLRRPHSILVNKIVAEISFLRFSPPIKDGQTIACWVTVPFTFKLVGKHDELFNAGKVALINGDYSSSTKKFLKALKKEKRQTDIWIWLGIAYAKQQAYQQARDAFRQAQIQVGTYKSWMKSRKLVYERPTYFDSFSSGICPDEKTNQAFFETLALYFSL